MKKEIQTSIYSLPITKAKFKYSFIALTFYTLAFGHSGFGNDHLNQKVKINLSNESLESTIKGKVKDENGQAMPGVSISIKGTNLGTQTDINGSFSLTIQNGQNDLIFSFVGYETQQFRVGNQTLLEITLKPDVKSLDEVVVVGYGSQKKLTMTSAVTQIKGSDLVRRPVSNLQQALQGQAPGLTVLDRGGEPGRSAATLRVRGITTFSGNSSENSSPLIIVDGVEQTLFNLNPED
jgi:hypothetical protein